MSNTCKAFEMADMKEQREHFSKLEVVERFENECNGKDLYKYDEGCRILKRCPACDALVLCQYSVLHYYPDDDEYYTDYFSVGSREEAVELNEKYDILNKKVHILFSTLVLLNKKWCFCSKFWIHCI